MWTPTDEREFITRLAAMAEYFGKPLSEAAQEIYLRGLEDLPASAVFAAMNATVQHCTFLPKVSEIREIVLGSTKDRAEAAWLHVLSQVRRVGYTGQPTLTADEWRAVESVFGSWGGCCQTLPSPDEPMFAALAKQFKAAHETQRRQEIAGELGPSRDEAKTLLGAIQNRVKALPS